MFLLNKVYFELDTRLYEGSPDPCIRVFNKKWSRWQNLICRWRDNERRPRRLKRALYGASL